MSKSSGKIGSVLDISRYKTGDMLWWVVFRSTPAPVIHAADAWMIEHHPKALYTRGPFKHMLPRHTSPPKLQHSDFDFVVTLLASKLTVEQFVVCNIMRSTDTGEFFYSNSSEEWMPESYLMDSKAAANREKCRIMRLIKNWSTDG